MADLDTFLAKAQDVIDATQVGTEVVTAISGEVLDAFRALSAAQQEDIRDLLTGNPIADRARLETAAAAGVCNAAIDWANVPGTAFLLARKALELATLGAALL